MMKYFKIFKINRLTLGCVLGAMIVVSSCTKYANPAAVYEEYEQEGLKQVKRKVLFISIDGLVGQELKKNIPANIAELLKTSKYTFESIASENTKDASTWMTMMSGVSYDMHQIEDDSYIPKPDEDHPHDNPAGYPSMLYRMATVAPSQKTYVVARDQSINTKLLVSAEESFDATTDEAVKDKVIALMEKKNPDLAIVQFKDVLNAGVTNGFSVGESAYAEAIKKVDGYIGEILTALKARKNYGTEDWLVILTSNHGGIDKTYGGSSLAERNTFAIFQNQKFKPLELKTDMIKSVRFFGFYDAGQSNYAYYNSNAFRGRNNPVLEGESIYDIGTTKEFTVEAKIKMNPTNGVYNYASNTPFLGKNAQRSGQTPGWAFFKLGNEVRFFVADGTAGMEANMGNVSTSGEWAHIAAVVKLENNVPTTTTYVNGVKAGSATNAALKLQDVKTATGLTFGYFPYVFSGLPIDFQMCDVHIYNKAMDEDLLKKNSNRLGIPQDELSNPNLIGYWPIDQLTGNQFENKIAGKPNIAMQGQSRLVLQGNNLPYVDPDAVLIQGEDMFPQIFYWLEIQTHQEWNLQGQLFLTKYEVEFLMPEQLK